MKHTATVSILHRYSLFIKVLLLALFVWGTNRGIYERIQAIGWHPAGLAVFAIIWLLAMSTLLLLAFSPHRWIRWPWSFALLASSFIGLSHWLVTAKHLGLDDLEKLVGLLAFVDNVTGFFGELLVSSAIWCSLGAVAINLPPFQGKQIVRTAWNRVLNRAGLLQIAPILAISCILYVRGGEGTNGFPVQYNSLAFITVLGVEAVLQPAPLPRRQVALTPTPNQAMRHVVVLMDESVRGDLLDINSPEGVNTNISLAGTAIANFGIASSAANCSESSNVSVRYGATRKNYLQELALNPSIWNYAKKAGYHTVFIDCQRLGGRLHNGMTNDELSWIDEFIQFDNDPQLDRRDLLAATKVRQILQQNEAPQFIYVNKMGAHFPYEGKYPVSQAIYSPTMAFVPAGIDANAKSVAKPADEDIETRLRFRNSYLNAISWNTLKFFEILLPGLNLDQTVIIYTSDHGQDFHEDGRPGYDTHCTTGPAAPEEGMVPLVFATREERFAKELQRAAGTNYNRTSQFNLFPTLLLFMGYKRDQLLADRGFEPTVFDALPDNNRRFLSTFYVRWGKPPVWNDIPHSSPGVIPASQ